MRYWVYLARCGDCSLYAGATTDLERRLHQHNSSQGAKYTASRLPVRLAQAWEIQTWSDALRLEIVLKKCNKKMKEELLLEPQRIRALAHKHNLDFGISIYVREERREHDADSAN